MLKETRTMDTSTDKPDEWICTLETSLAEHRDLSFYERRIALIIIGPLQR